MRRRLALSVIVLLIPMAVLVVHLTSESDSAADSAYRVLCC